ncbi:MAG: non-ribosomal peptide synthetase, partial [Solirubrobacteraceae bacterium]
MPKRLRAKQVRGRRRAAPPSEAGVVQVRASAGNPLAAPETYAPLLPAQRHIWLLQRLFPGGNVHAVPIAILFEGRLDKAVLQQAIDTLVERHPALRTTIGEEDGVPIQCVSAPAGVPFETLRLRRTAIGDGEERALDALPSLVQATLQVPFDFNDGPLFRAGLFKRSARSHVLLLTLHRIVFDDASARTLVHELGALYRGIAAGQPAPLPPLPTTPQALAVARAEEREAAKQPADLAWWRETLADVEPLHLPADRRPPAIPSQRGGRHAVSLPAEIVAPLLALGDAEGATLFVLLLAAFAGLLARWSGGDEITVGTPHSIRPEGAEAVIGQLTNTLVLRVDLSGDPSFRDLIRRTRDVVEGALAHAATPFERIVDDLKPQRSLNRTPLAQVSFAVHDGPPGLAPTVRLQGSVMAIDPGTSLEDLALDVTRVDAALQGWWRYSYDRFDPATISRMAAQFELLLQGAVNEPEQPLSTIPILTEAERWLMLEQWSPPAQPLVPPVAIDEVFWRQALATPQAPALRSGDETIAYADLDARVDGLAYRLRQEGVASGATVGFCLERTPLVPVAMLAILRAGGIALPLDPAYPAARLAFMIHDAGASLVLTDALGERSLSACVGRRLRLDRAHAPAASELGAPIVAGSAGDDPAYLVYTSGSTGVPKGVVGTHQGAVNLCRWIGVAYPFAPEDVCAFITSPSFVDAVWDLLGPLLNGAVTVIVPETVRRDPEQLIDLLAAQDVTRLILPPSLLRSMLDTGEDLPERIPKLRLLFSSAELLTPDLVAWIAERLPQARLVNTYGSSEVTAVVTTADVCLSAITSPRIPVGHPITGARVYVLDRHSGLAPVGVPGEIAVGGLPVAAGYHGRPDVTAERFVADPVAGDPRARLFRTGDHGRWLSDGTIEYLGRLDRLVKIRGFRVEPGEVESALAQHPAVAEAAVVARSDGSATQRLVAYVVPVALPGPAADELRAFLRGHLPEFMIPAQFVTLDAMPRTPTGKLDRCALLADTARPDLSAGYVAPRTPTEAALVSIWEQLLAVSPVGIHDNFFDLGGHSLLLVRTMSAIRDALGVDLAARTLFEAPTVASLADQVETARYGAAPLTLDSESGAVSAATPLNVGTGAGGIFFVPGGAGDAFYLFRFAKLLRSAAPHRPAWGFIGREQFSEEESPHAWVQAIAAQYVREMRALQPSGPYIIIGACAGGHIALEMAQQLHAGGAEMSRLIMIDARLAGVRRGRRLRESKKSTRTAAKKLESRLRRVGTDESLSLRAGDVLLGKHPYRPGARETIERQFWLKRYVAAPYPLPMTV